MATKEKKAAAASSEQNPMRRPHTGGLQAGQLVGAFGRLGEAGVEFWLLRDGGALPASWLGVKAALPAEYAALLLAIYTVAAVRHAYWFLWMSTNEVPVGLATGVVIFNAVFNLIGTVLAVSIAAAAPPGLLSFENPVVVAGAALFAVGILFEVVAEEQRKAFKANPRNKGRPFLGGFNSIVQHPNYFGYTVWRTGLMLVTTSYIAAAIAFLFNVASFLFSAIPDLQGHNLRKYGDEYRRYTQRTAKLLPFLI